MKVIATYPDLVTAEMAKSILEAHDIPAWVPDSNLAGLDWRLGTALGGVRLQVDERHAEAAKELLDTELSGVSELGHEEFDAEELCPHCNSAHIGPENHRRLKVLTLMFFPVAIITVPIILLARKKVRCSDCGGTW